MKTDLRKFMRTDLGKKPESIKSSIIDINDTLIYFQKMKIIHGDLKPENIMVDEKGNVKVGDFGTAIVVAATKKSGDLFGMSA